MTTRSLHNDVDAMLLGVLPGSQLFGNQLEPTLESVVPRISTLIRDGLQWPL